MRRPESARPHPGGAHLYSEADIACLHRTGELWVEGVNHAGIRQVRRLKDLPRRP